MRPADLFRRTAFRLALGVTIFVVTALVLASTIGYSLLRAQLLALQDARVTEIVAALAETNRSGDEQDLIEAVTTRISASPDHATVFLLRDPEGKLLAANMPDIWYKPGWSSLLPTELGVSNDYRYRIFATTLGTHSLIVGLSEADLDYLNEISFGAFGWSALAVLISAIGVGAVIASRVQARITEVEATLHKVAQGDLTARLAVSGRHSDLDQIALAINHALARLGGLVEAMRQVSTDIAHDLRTPLNRLRIRIEAAQEAEAAGRPASADLTAALAESDALAQTFSALLRIAQVESGSSRARFIVLDLGTLALAVAEAYAEVAEEAGMALVCRAPSAAPVFGDKDLLTQVFANLIENALRHCPAGTKIICEVEAKGPDIVATLADTGHGIPLAERENVLRRLYRLEKSRTTEGSGLGLALVKAVADLHDARLTLGDAGPGLVVTLQFPRAE